MEYDGEEKSFPLINEGACSKCNNCVLCCPYMPIELPKLEDFYSISMSLSQRYAEGIPDNILGTVKQVTFAGTLCRIAGLKALMGDKLNENLSLKPPYCIENPEKEECEKVVYVISNSIRIG